MPALMGTTPRGLGLRTLGPRGGPARRLRSPGGQQGTDYPPDREAELTAARAAAGGGHSRAGKSLLHRVFEMPDLSRPWP